MKHNYFMRGLARNVICAISFLLVIVILYLARGAQAQLQQNRNCKRYLLIGRRCLPEMQLWPKRSTHKCHSQKGSCLCLYSQSQKCNMHYCRILYQGMCLRCYSDNKLPRIWSRLGNDYNRLPHLLNNRQKCHKVQSRLFFSRIYQCYSRHRQTHLQWFYQNSCRHMHQ